MNTLERYITRRMLAALFLVTGALTVTIWLSQTLRYFSIVTAGGQSVATFFHLTALILPSLLTVIGPVSLMVAVIYTLTTLNTSSELAILGASGAPPRMLLKPVLLIGTGVMLAVMSVTLFLMPETQRGVRDLLTRINTDILTSVIKDGQFIQVANGLTIHVKRRLPDTTLDGIFVSDSRDSGQIVTYAARRGAIVRTGPNSSFLIMQDGVIQRENKAEQSISMIEFRSYAFDLSSFTGGSLAATYQPSERTTAYLLDPDPNDPVFQNIPNRFRAELHDRIAAPLSVLVFALLPLAFLGEPRTNRQGRGRTIFGIALAGAIIRELQFLLLPGATSNPALVPYMYALPLGVIAFCLAGTLGLIPLHLPLPMARAIDGFWLRLSRLFRRASSASGSGRAS